MRDETKRTGGNADDRAFKIAGAAVSAFEARPARAVPVPGKNGALEYVRQAGCIQFDPVDVCGKNAELVLQVRNIWYEDGVRETKALRANVERCMRRFAAFNGCAQLAMPGGPDVPV